MEKRKRRADRNKTPPSPGFMTHTYHMESSSKENSSNSAPPQYEPGIFIKAPPPCFYPLLQHPTFAKK
nr:hypothetical protein [Tanacetum cinerariifolium]